MVPERHEETNGKNDMASQEDIVHVLADVVRREGKHQRHDDHRLDVA